MPLPDEILTALAPEEMEWDDYVKGFLSAGGDAPLAAERFAMMSHFLRSTPIGVMIVDAGERVLLINDAASALFDHDRTQVPDTTWTKLSSTRTMKGIDSKELTDDTDPIRVAIGQHMKMTSNVTLVDPDTEAEDWVVITASPIFSDCERRHVVGAAVTIEDVTDYRGMQDILYHQATHDQTTGLLNRSSMMSSLSKSLARSKRTGAYGALLYMNVDGFNDVNESLGHSSGDQLLAKVAERLLAEVRDTDVVSRLGGDEFGVLLSDVPQADVRRVAGEVADRVCSSVSRPYSLKTGEAVVSISVGVCVFLEDATDEDAIVMKADEAMHAAKSSEPGTWKFWDASMRHHAQG